MPEPIAGTALPQLTHPFLARFVQDESGQDVIEYALVAAMVALGSVSGTANVAVRIADTFTSVSNSLDSATSASAPDTSAPPAPTPPGGGRRGGGNGGGNHNGGGGGGHHHRFF
jgi:pilus assembly protein Flp/PilA